VNVQWERERVCLWLAYGSVRPHHFFSSLTFTQKSALMRAGLLILSWHILKKRTSIGQIMHLKSL